ncbi:MAG: hypothetical protein FWC36_04540 [Spirochaetes bacterium]|nr:hypothetical protein [Spirochaetota bacterium]
MNRNFVLTAFILFSGLFLMSQTPLDPQPAQSAASSPHKTELIRMLEKRFNITDRNIITALRSTSRADFLPEEFQRHAYIDISLPVDNNNLIISYSDLLKGITSLRNPRREKALVIGRNSSFTAVILSFLYREVYLIESNIALQNRTGALIRERHPNIIPAYTTNFSSFNANAPFDLVFINGSINEFTAAYLNLLTQNGEAIFALSDMYGFSVLHKATRIGASYNLIALGEVLFSPLN